MVQCIRVVFLQKLYFVSILYILLVTPTREGVNFMKIPFINTFEKRQSKRSEDGIFLKESFVENV